MTCRLYIDEVGNDDTTTPTERFLSLTGIITKTHGHDTQITLAIEELKARLFGHPSHQSMKSAITGEAMTARFGRDIVNQLEFNRYRRSPARVIDGWGRKKLP